MLLKKKRRKDKLNGILNVFLLETNAILAIIIINKDSIQKKELHNYTIIIRHNNNFYNNNHNNLHLMANNGNNPAVIVFNSKYLLIILI